MAKNVPALKDPANAPADTAPVSQTEADTAMAKSGEPVVEQSPPEAPAAFAPKSKAHAGLIDRFEDSIEHLESVVAAHFTHLEADAVASAMRVYHRAIQELRGLGVLPTP